MNIPKILLTSMLLLGGLRIMATEYCQPTFNKVGNQGTVMAFNTTGAEVNLDYTGAFNQKPNGIVGNTIEAYPGSEISFNLFITTFWGYSYLYVDLNGNGEFEENEFIKRWGDTTDRTYFNETDGVQVWMDDDKTQVPQIIVPELEEGSIFRIRVINGPESGSTACGTWTEGSYCDFEVKVLANKFTYCIPEGETNTRYNPTPGKIKDWTNERRLETITISGATVSGVETPFSNTLNNADGQTKVALDCTETVINATKGDMLNISWTWRETIDWMHYYVYIDYNQDGVFNETDELVSYTYFSGTEAEIGYDSAGKEVGYGEQRRKTPAFTIPGDVKSGKTRLRIKIDWDSKNPCGNPSPNNLIGYNGGTIIDYTINIQKSTSHTITINEPVGGTLTVSQTDGTPVTSGEKIETGTVLSITATAEDGYQLQEITLNRNPIENNTFTVTEDTEIAAKFTDKLILNYTISEGSSLKITDETEQEYPNNSEVVKGTDLTLAITVPDGHEVTSLMVNEKDVTEDLKENNTYVITNCQNNLQIDVVVAKKRFEVTFETPAKDIGTLTVRNETTSRTVSSGDLIEFGDNLNVTVKPSQISKLTSLLINGEEVKDYLENNMISITAEGPVNIAATFEVESFELTWSINGKGTVQVVDADIEKEISNGESIIKNHYLMITMTPDEKYEIDSIAINKQGIDISEDNLDIEKYEDHWIYWYLMLEDSNIEIFFVNPNGGVGTKDISADLFRIFYNDKEQTLEIPEKAKAVVYDIAGNKIMNIETTVTSMNGLSNGYYLVKVFTAQGSKTVKFIKK